MSDAVEEIRCALAMRDAGYAVLFDHETSAELLRCYDIAVKGLEAVAQARMPGEARRIARDALAAVGPSGIPHD